MEFLQKYRNLPLFKIPKLKLGICFQPHPPPFGNFPQMFALLLVMPPLIWQIECLLFIQTRANYQEYDLFQYQVWTTLN